MERKNTILLTVIAVATLLVAVVGATFAYFTATVTTENEANNQTTVKTYALATAVMDMGSVVTAEGVYPGFKAAKEVTVKGSCEDGQTCEDINAVITVTPTIPTEFGTNVSWKLYKSATPITCSGNDVTDGGQYYSVYTCNTEVGTVVIDNGSTTEQTYDVVVTGSTNENYYLVVDYANVTTGDQNAEQGKTFSVAMTFASK